MMEEQYILCPVCHRSQPESLGACDFCEELRQEAAQDAYEDRQRRGYGVEDD